MLRGVAGNHAQTLSQVVLEFPALVDYALITEYPPADVSVCVRLGRGPSLPFAAMCGLMKSESLFPLTLALRLRARAWAPLSTPLA